MKATKLDRKADDVIVCVGKTRGLPRNFISNTDRADSH